MQSSVLGKTLLLVLLVLFYQGARSHHLPPQPMPVDAPEATYSAERAFAHVRRIGSEPHPAGSRQAAEVRDYIVEAIERLGLQAEIQETMVYRAPVTAATVQNVLTRIPGQSSRGNAVALMAHYDSVVFGPGAADDGAGVASLLEAMRALKAGPPLFNDVIFIFTDAEEGRLQGSTGLLGAHAFVEHHPWMEDVRVVVNFDARGVRGTTYMYQTSGRNAWLIRALAQSGARASASSFMFEVYDAMPVGSDMTAFIQAGVLGYDCAFINGLQKYHTMLDAPEYVSLASLQHNGEYALTLVKHLGNQPLDEAAQATSNVVYFDIFGHRIIHYSLATAVIFTLITIAAYLVALWFGLRSGEVTVRGLLGAFISYMLWSAFCVGLAGMVMVIGYRVRGVYILYSSDSLTLGTMLIGAGASMAVLRLIMDRCGVYNAIMGFLMPWALLLILATILVPGVTFALTWPLLFALAAVGHTLTRRDQLETVSVPVALLFAVAALPTIFFMVVIIQGFYEALLFIFVPLHMGVLLLILGILMPQLRLVTGDNRLQAPGMLTLMGLGFLLIGIMWPGFSAEQPRFNSIAYGLNADTGEAFYMSCDEEIDGWTAQFFPPDTQKQSITEFIPIASRAYLKAPAPVVSLDAPTLEVISDKTEGDRRHLHVRVDSARGAEVVVIYAEPETQVLAASVNGRELVMTETPWRLSYSVYRGGGIDLELTLPASGPAKFRIADHQYYPEEMLGYAPRPPQFVPKPNTVDFNRDPLKSEESIVAAMFDLSAGYAL